MIANADILLLSEPDAGLRLSGRLGDEVATKCCHDPYDVLQEASSRSWGAVVLTAFHADFEGLCRATRRLQDDGKLYVLCTPADEPDVRLLRGDVIDDYFISPPTNRELDLLRKAVKPNHVLPAGNGLNQASLAPGDFATLAEAARNCHKLEQAVCDLVSQRTSASVTWADTGDDDKQGYPLLFIVAERPRVLMSNLRAEELDDEQAAFVTALQQCLPSLTALASRAESLHRLAITDHLTGTYNRRYFYHITDKILRRADEENFDVTLLLYDIDDFKHFNDTYGYAAGDEILRETANLMKQTTRNQDIVARIGGDEFAVLFWDTDEPRQPGSKPPETAYVLADRFRRAVSDHTFKSLGPEATGALTVSGGLANYGRDGTTCRELLRCADEAIKSAKKSGKNAIQLIG